MIATHENRRMRILRSCLHVIVITAGVIAIFGSASRPPTSTSPPSTPDVNETTPLSTVRLIDVKPSIPLPDQRLVRIDRNYRVKSSSHEIQYISNGRILLTDREIQFEFGFSALDVFSVESSSGPIVLSNPLSLSLVVRNGSGSGLIIDWNAVSIIDHRGIAQGVIHRGVKMADRSGVMAPSTIPPGALLEDFVYPKELLSFSGGRYASWSAVNFFEAMKPGQQFRLYFPVKRGGETVEYQFVFEVSGP